MVKEESLSSKTMCKELLLMRTACLKRNNQLVKFKQNAKALADLNHTLVALHLPRRAVAAAAHLHLKRAKEALLLILTAKIARVNNQNLLKRVKHRNQMTILKGDSNNKTRRAMTNEDKQFCFILHIFQKHNFA